MSCGAGIARYLIGKGYNVVEVLSPERKRKKRGVNKNDLKDAERAADDPVKRALHMSAKSLAGMWIESKKQAEDLRSEIEEIMEENAPAFAKGDVKKLRDYLRMRAHGTYSYEAVSI